MVSHRMGNGSPIAALGICAMAWTMVVATGSASAQVRSPAPGSSFEFRCNLPGTGDFVQRYTVDSVSGGIVTVSSIVASTVSTVARAVTCVSVASSLSAD